MARERSAAPARMSGGPLALRVLAPLAVVAVLIGLAVALVANAGGQKAANKELDARALTVKRSWEALGAPSGKTSLAKLRQELGAKPGALPGRQPARGKPT